MTLLLKPHHFMDIFKVYGTGIKRFFPDKKYKHHFYKAGNIVLKNPLTIISLTIGADDVCNPCRFLKKGKCTDKIADFVYSSKEKWNKIIDKRILKRVGLREGERMSALELCRMIEEKLTTSDDIAQIWKERPSGETEKRIKYFFIGLKKYLNNIKRKR